nr:MAG TPA: hypothetical protein [Caudoviricetes sp.]
MVLFTLFSPFGKKVAVSFVGSFKYCQKTFMNLLKNTWEGDSKWLEK